MLLPLLCYKKPNVTIDDKAEVENISDKELKESNKEFLKIRRITKLYIRFLTQKLSKNDFQDFL